jgi:hypothetical protein
MNIGDPFIGKANRKKKSHLALRYLFAELFMCVSLSTVPHFSRIRVKTNTCTHHKIFLHRLLCSATRNGDGKMIALLQLVLEAAA